MLSVGRRFSEDHLIEFDFKMQVLCFVGILAFLACVAFRLHYSSIELWNTELRNVKPTEVNSALLFGSPRGVRSDEWEVSTPGLLNVYANPAGPSRSHGALDVVRPWDWGYYFLGLERGFSFMWNFWYFGSFFSFLLLMMLLTSRAARPARSDL